MHLILSLFDFRLDLSRNENSGSAAAKKQPCGKNSKNRVQTQTAQKKKGKNHLNSFAEGSHAYHVCDDLLADELVDNVGQVRHLCYCQCYLCHNHLLSHCHHFIVTWTTDCHLWHMNEWITTKSETTVNERLVAFSVDLQKRKIYCLTT